MPTPLFTLAVPLIINQPCNYTAEQRTPAIEEEERKRGNVGRKGKDGNFCLKQLLKRREGTEAWSRRNCGRRKKKALKGDNKEPLKEQMKMSFPLLPQPLPPLLHPAGA